MDFIKTGSRFWIRVGQQVYCYNFRGSYNDRTIRILGICCQANKIIGAILSVLSIYGFYFLKNKKIYINLLAAFIPTAITGLILYRFIKKFLLNNSLITVAALLIGGIVLIVMEKILTPSKN